MALPQDFPPVVYVPCHDEVSDPSDAQIVYRRTNDGREALLVYSALDRLKAGMGDRQPWLLIPTVELEKVWQVDKFDLMVMDIAVPEDHWVGPGGAA